MVAQAESESGLSWESRPFSCAHRLASVRFATPSFLYTLDRWNLIVCSVTQSMRASWELECPSATSRRISTSRRVRDPGRSRPLDGCDPLGEPRTGWPTVCLTASATSSGRAGLTTYAAAPAASAPSLVAG